MEFGLGYMGQSSRPVNKDEKFDIHVVLSDNYLLAKFVWKCQLLRFDLRWRLGLLSFNNVKQSKQEDNVGWHTINIALSFLYRVLYLYTRFHVYIYVLQAIFTWLSFL